MAFEKLTNNLKGLTDNGQEYANHTAEYYKLSLFKNGMKGLIGAANLGMRVTIALISLVFISIGIAIVINESLNSLSAGYFIVGAFYFLVFILVFVFAAKPVERMLLTKFSKIAFSNHTPDEVMPEETTKPFIDENI
ncbi:phage holin family protein [Dokdonia sp. Hel_I_53]|uniref:phage holin family protein n=1 Tax=Dokdonia sp. Hel_I_53 TaxID=1566287 RepID=UPI00119B0C13|nr:phage holin family protein [Dokdonia sp. Hel_I_53]TVZ52641.1 putative superfamily III holin-X [Dokdonia sp. Hel_I_53]